jgi:FlaG/FlaF family flagellin (archaellin)
MIARIRRLFKDEGAVSPVIGTLLMVSITVIIAAVIGTYVIGLGNQFTRTAPQALIGVENSTGTELGTTGASNSEIEITFKHGGTDTLTADDTEIKVAHRGETVTFDNPASKDAKFTTADTMTVTLDEDGPDTIAWPSDDDLYSKTGFDGADVLDDSPVTVTLIHTPTGQIIAELTTTS